MDSKRIRTKIEWNLTVIRQTRLTPEFTNLLYRIIVALFFISVVITIEGTLLWLVSKDIDVKLNNIGDGIYFLVVSIFGETIGPTSLYARIIMIVGLIEGLVLATYLIAIAAFFTIRGGRIMTRKHTNHILICGWNFQGERIVEELLNARANQKFDIVIIASEDKMIDIAGLGKNVFLVNGSSTDDATLLKANIETARSAIILTDESLEPDGADANVLMTTLAVETLNPQVYTCAQIMNSENAIHLKRANVDELILFDVIGANLAVASALNPGVTRMLSELVHFDEGCELYKISPPLPNKLVGKYFKQALHWFSNIDMILIGVESDSLQNSYSATQTKHLNVNSDNRGVYLNPKNHKIDTNDALFVISKDPPELNTAE